MLLPFEGSGVDTQWQFSLPQAANPFDYSSIADLLVQIDYTALADADYGTLVTRQLNANLDRSSDCVFSLARDFPDQWYELNNPDPAAADGRATTLSLARNDFPMALQGLLTTQVALGLSISGTSPPPQVQVSVTRTAEGATIGGAAGTDSTGVASTRRSAPAWSSLQEIDPTGSWRISLDASADPLFASGQLNDLLFIISWRGRAPAWPA